MKDLKFEVPSMARQKEYRHRLTQCAQVPSDYSFVNIWGWRSEYELSWAWTPQLVWIRQERPQPCYWAPVGAWEAIDWRSLLPQMLDSGAEIIRVPEALLSIWQDQFSSAIIAAEDRGHWDYVYRLTDLAQLKGNRYHKKKNLVNQFKKKHDYRYLAMDPETSQRALDLQIDWCTWRDCESVETLDAENRVITDVLNAWSQLDSLLGGALEVDDRIVAYTVAEMLTNDTLLVHFEKANPEYKGVYQAINQMLLSHAPDEAVWVNREQDLDDPGLRKAKLSYHPEHFVEKYRVRLA